MRFATPLAILAFLSLPLGASPAAPKGPRAAVLKAGHAPFVGEGQEKKTNVVEVVELWRQSKGGDDYGKVIRQRFKSTKIRTIRITGTAYSLLVLDGDFAPLLLDGMEWVLWSIEGLGERFQHARDIAVIDRKVTVSQVEGLADLDLAWTLDFAHPDQGFVARYEERGGF